MTLSERNTFFKVGIAICAVCVLIILAASFIIIPHYQDQALNRSIMEENTRRPENIIQIITGSFMPNSYYAVHASLVLSILFSLTGIILIHYYFERTSAPEILYIAIFTISFSFEVIRLVLPLHFIMNFPSFYIATASKLLLFARFFGIFSLFAASICAAGLEVQKVRNVLFTILIATLVITMGIPIDALNWDTSLNMVNGFRSMFRMIELVTLLTTTASFLIAAKNKSSREYLYVAIGITAALAGRNILLGTDNWAGSILGILMLSFGSWFLCSKLHKINLWL
jgi:hypothetical protein